MPQVTKDGFFGSPIKRTKLERQFLTERRALKRLMEKERKRIDAVYSAKATAFRKKVVPYKVGKVYELAKNGHARKGYKRFVLYSFDFQYAGEGYGRSLPRYLFIKAGVWWLNADGVPERWDGLTVYGASNNAEFVLSKDQTNKPVPEHLM